MWGARIKQLHICGANTRSKHINQSLAFAHNKLMLQCYMNKGLGQVEGTGEE